MSSPSELRLLFVDIVRRGYGRRYTWLPVDRLDREGFEANFEGAYLRPNQIDVRPDDIARWREGDSFFQARVVAVVLDGDWLRVSFDDLQRIPIEVYFS
jgi:hypothetical protein